MNSKELKAEMRNKLQSIRVIIEQLNKGKDVPKSIIELSIKDLNSVEDLIDEIGEKKFQGHKTKS